MCASGTRSTPLRTGRVSGPFALVGVDTTTTTTEHQARRLIERAASGRPSRCWVMVVLAALICALAVSCGGSGGSSGSVRFLVFGDPPEINAYRTLIDAFQREEPDIAVELIEASDRDDLLARLSTSFAGGSPPDLFLMNYRFYGQFATRGVLEPLEPYAEDSGEFEL